MTTRDEAIQGQRSKDVIRRSDVELILDYYDTITSSTDAPARDVILRTGRKALGFMYPEQLERLYDYITVVSGTPVSATFQELIQSPEIQRVGLSRAMFIRMLDEIVPVQPTYSSFILADTPVGYWRCEDTGPDQVGSLLVDSSGNGHDLTQAGTGAIYAQPGQVDNAVEQPIGGTAPRWEITDAASSNAFDFTANLTVEAWIWKEAFSLANGTAIVTKNDASGGAGTNNYDLALFNSGTAPRLGVNLVGNINVNVLAVTQPAAQTWTHVVGVRDGTALRIYINGQLDNTNSPISGGALTDTASNLTLATYHVGSFGMGFQGRLDEVAVYNYALSATRIQAHYDARNFSG
jgi:hypothetical protein